MSEPDPLYIGWQSKAPPEIGKPVRWAVIVLLLVIVGLAFLLGPAQRTIGRAMFEWGKIKTFSGVLKVAPYPHLLVTRPGHGQATVSSYYLVAPFKFGLDARTIGTLDGRVVSCSGTLIYRGNQTMIEVQSIKASVASGNIVAAPERVSLGRQTLVGEIVDSKCYLGVMNPGQLAPHRACAVRCISGGIPPVLLVRQKEGPPLYFLLVSADGRPVNKQVLDMVAEPVEITGETVRQGDLFVLRADPSTYRRAR